MHGCVVVVAAYLLEMQYTNTQYHTTTTTTTTEFLPLGTLSGPEQKALQALKPELKSSIAKGVAFVANKSSST